MFDVMTVTTVSHRDNLLLFSFYGVATKTVVDSTAIPPKRKQLAT